MKLLYSGEEFCDQPVKAQLTGLMKRSVVHHAERINCPLLMFIGGRYNGSVFHKSHGDFIKELKRHKKEYEYDIVPGGGHNFVLYYDSKPAKYAYEKHMKFLLEKFPPLGVVPAAKVKTLPALPKK